MERGRKTRTRTREPRRAKEGQDGDENGEEG
jgi:hypothetical protein